MKRAALLIESSDIPGDEVAGAKEDVEAFYYWLYSNAGGDWFDTEIVKLHTPTIRAVKNALTKIGRVDYAFVAFAGHGYHAKDLDLTKLFLLDGTMTVREIIPDTDRASIVVDACRKVVPQAVMESIQLSTGVINKYARVAAKKNYRASFDRHIADAETGYEFLYACDLGESAGGNTSGGIFSRSLVDEAMEFSHNSDGKHWLSVKTIFTRAAALTTARNRPQHPQFEPGRRTAHFPFAV